MTSNLLLQKQPLNKRIRIKNKNEFNDIIKKGFLFRSKNFRAFVLQETNLKVGFAVEKGEKAAVKNRQKRRLLEIFRLTINRYDIQGHIIFIIMSKSIREKFSNLQIEFSDLLEKIKNNSRQL